MLTDTQLARLPKYGQEEIARLDRERARLEGLLQQAHGEEPSGNNTWVAEMARNGQKRQSLGRSPRIRFETKDGPIECVVTLDGVLDISDVTGFGVLVIPQASNRITVIPGRIQ